MVDITRTSN